MSKVLANSIVALVSCLVIGVIFNGWSVFSFHTSAFQFVIYGTLGSFFYFSLKVSRRDSLALLLVLFFVQTSLITRSYSSVFFLRDVIFFLAVSGAIYTFFIYFNRPKLRDKWMEPLILAVLFALYFLTALVALHAFRGVFLSFEQLRFIIIPVMENGFLIGLGIGLGTVLVETDGLNALRKKVKSLLS